MEHRFGNSSVAGSAVAVLTKHFLLSIYLNAPRWPGGLWCSSLLARAGDRRRTREHMSRSAGRDLKGGALLLRAGDPLQDRGRDRRKGPQRDQNWVSVLLP